MSVMMLGMYRIKPGRQQDWLDAAQEFRKHVRRLGGRAPYRLVRQTFAGEMSGGYVSRTEFDDLAALGDFIARRNNDPEAQPLLASVQSDDFPAVVTAHHVYQFLYEVGDLDGEQVGNAIWRRTWQIKPGRLNDALALSEESAARAMQHGARSVRVVRNVFGGPMTGLYSTFSRFDSLSALGAEIDRSATDPTVQSLIRRANAEDSPFTPVGQGVGLVVQI